MKTEIDRIQKVYQHYNDTDIPKKRWDMKNPGNIKIESERATAILQLFKKNDFLPLHNLKILDIGCGVGKNLANFLNWGANPNNLFGVDLLQDRIDLAKKNLREINFFHMNAEELEFKDEYFDLIIVFTVYSSILEKQMLLNVTSQINRVLKKNGAVLWYDFRYDNPRNSNVRGVSLKQIKNYFVNYEYNIQSISVYPPLVRKLGSINYLIYPLINRIYFLRTHYLGLLTKK